MLYMAGYDIGIVGGLGTVALTTSGKPTVTVSLGAIVGNDVNGVASSLFLSHRHGGVTGQDPSASVRFSQYAMPSFANALEAALEAGAVAQGWTSTAALDVTVSATTGRFTIAYSLPFSIAWSTSKGAQFMSFGSQSSASSTSHTGNITPLYVIAPTLLATSEPSPNYEPSPIGSRAIADSGDGYGIARSVSPLYRDWVQQYEIAARTLRLSAVTSHPWTLQDLFEQCRTVYPFVVVDGFATAAAEVFSFRPESSWHPKPAGPGNHSQFHVPFACIVEGYAG